MRCAVLGCCLFGLAGCLQPLGFGTGTGAGSSAGSGSTNPIITVATGKNAPLPTEPDALLAFLHSEGYREYAHDEKLHATSSPHGVAGIKRFYQPKLVASLTEKALEHPAGAGAVLELYAADGVTRTGWAVSVKLAELSDGGSNWLWFEAVDGPSPQLVDGGEGLGLCTNCHASGDDYVLGGTL